MRKWIIYLHLIRPANIVTAYADILAGFGIAAVPLIHSSPDHWVALTLSLLLLLISTTGLYGGGVTFNDVCDANLDRIERPERPIPKGMISKMEALFLSVSLLIVGVIAASLVSITSAILAMIIIFLSIIYDAYTKHFLWLGPLNMACCRSGNLLLGMSIVNSALSDYWMLMFIPLVYITAVTLISKGEVQGGNRKILIVSLILYVITFLSVFLLGLTVNFKLLDSLPFLIIFGYLIFTSIIKAIRSLDGAQIRKTVKISILCLIILDAAVAAGYAGWWYGLIIMILLPISIGLGKRFAVT